MIWRNSDLLRYSNFFLWFLQYVDGRKLTFQLPTVAKVRVGIKSGNFRVVMGWGVGSHLEFYYGMEDEKILLLFIHFLIRFHSLCKLFFEIHISAMFFPTLACFVLADLIMHAHHVVVWDPDVLRVPSLVVYATPIKYSFSPDFEGDILCSSCTLLYHAYSGSIPIKYDKFFSWVVSQCLINLLLSMCSRRRRTKFKLLQFGITQSSSSVHTKWWINSGTPNSDFGFWKIHGEYNESKSKVERGFSWVFFAKFLP